MDQRGTARPVTLTVVGAGLRDRQYADLAVESGCGRVVAVFDDWAARPRWADALILATQDRDHVGPALALAEAGDHILQRARRDGVVVRL